MLAHRVQLLLEISLCVRIISLQPLTIVEQVSVKYGVVTVVGVTRGSAGHHCHAGRG
jgi:hypothetical protein